MVGSTGTALQGAKAIHQIKTVVLVILPYLILEFFPPRLMASTPIPFDYSLYAETLKTYVDQNGLVNYQRLKSAGAELRAFVQQLAKTSPENHPEIFPNRETQLAYWINAYNAFALKGVTDNYPTKSIRSIKYLYGFFWRMKFETGRRKYTLRHIENEIIRKRYQDPRIHFTLVYASMGCPRLRREPFLPERLSEQLDDGARSFIEETQNVQIDETDGKLRLSKIFAPSWYEGDFLYWYSLKHPGSKPEIRNYLALYLSSGRKKLLEAHPNLKTEYLDFDWSLNDQALHPAF
ncbi:MAG TPA: DUF547 domain-containing protein [Terriglobia bacterium]|nr:DUF547 domain-containing protein [Terriglobia bacterium]